MLGTLDQPGDAIDRVGQMVQRRAQEVGARVRQLRLASEAVQHADAAQAVLARGAHVVQSIAYHQGLRASEVKPGAELELIHVHARWSRVHFRLPDETPRMACQVPCSERVELESKVRSVFIDLDESRVCVCWVGETPLDVPLNAEQSKRITHAVLW